MGRKLGLKLRCGIGRADPWFAILCGQVVLGGLECAAGDFRARDARLERSWLEKVARLVRCLRARGGMRRGGFRERIGFF